MYNLKSEQKIKNIVSKHLTTLGRDLFGDIARELNIPEQLLYKYSIGVRDIHLGTLIKLQKVLNIPISEFLEGEDDDDNYIDFHPASYTIHKLIEVRKSKDLTIKDVSDKSGLPEYIIRNVECGVGDLYVSIVGRIANALTIPYNELFASNEDCLVCKGLKQCITNEEPVNVLNSLRGLVEYYARKKSISTSLIPSKLGIGSEYYGMIMDCEISIDNKTAIALIEILDIPIEELEPFLDKNL